MKVECTKLLNYSGIELRSSPWIKIGNVYHVMSISIDIYGTRRYSIVTSNDESEKPNLGAHLAECFRIVTTKIPSCWKFWITESTAMGIGPIEWQNPGFEEAFYSGDQWALKLFEVVRRRIISEDP